MTFVIFSLHVSDFTIIAEGSYIRTLFDTHRLISDNFRTGHHRDNNIAIWILRTKQTLPSYHDHVFWIRGLCNCCSIPEVNFALAITRYKIGRIANVPTHKDDDQ
jgi:hypothetical protein